MRPLKLRAMYHSGAGWKIDALIPKSVNCAEFTMKDFCFQPFVEMHDNVLQGLVGYSPFIQFTPKEWSEMIEAIYTEMVDLWNAKNAKKDSNTVETTPIDEFDIHVIDRYVKQGSSGGFLQSAWSRLRPVLTEALAQQSTKQSPETTGV